MCAGRSGAPAARATAAKPARVRVPLHPDTLARFVDPLPVPRVLSAQGMRPDPSDPQRQLPYYRVAMREARVRVHRDVPPTRMWTYDGEMPGPTLETRSGRGLLVEWVNELPARHFLPIDHTLHGAGADRPEVRAVVHVHGARVPPESDGYPEDWYVPGQSALLHYPNQQDAATLWYHDHAMGIERLNQYAGLLGCFLVRDEVEDALGLPGGAHEMPLVLCDRLFDADGQLHYPASDDPAAPWVSEVYGDATLVNGKLYPYLEVEPRSYRFRVLNASNARFYTLSVAATTPRPEPCVLHQIGTDQGLLPAPVALASVTLAPAERADVVVDFDAFAGRTLVLFRPRRAADAVPCRARPSARGLGRCRRRSARCRGWRPSAAVKTRTLTLDEYHDVPAHRMLMLLDGKYWHDPVTEKPAARHGRGVELDEPHRRHPPHPPAPRALPDPRSPALRRRRVPDLGNDALARSAGAPRAERGGMEGHRGRRSRHGHAHHRALRGLRRPLRLALPRARARGQRDDAPLRGGGARVTLSRCCAAPRRCR